MVYETPKSNLETVEATESSFGSLLNILLYIILVITVVYWFYPYISPFWLSFEDLEVLSYTGYKSLYPTTEIEFWFWGLYWVIVTIALIRRWRVFRIIYLAGLILSTILSLAWGYQVLTPMQSLLGYIMSLIDGAVVILIYFTPVSREFK